MNTCSYFNLFYLAGHWQSLKIQLRLRSKLKRNVSFSAINSNKGPPFFPLRLAPGHFCARVGKKVPSLYIISCAHTVVAFQAGVCAERFWKEEIFRSQLDVVFFVDDFEFGLSEVAEIAEDALGALEAQPGHDQINALNPSCFRQIVVVNLLQGTQLVRLTRTQTWWRKNFFIFKSLTKIHIIKCKKYIKSIDQLILFIPLFLRSCWSDPSHWYIFSLFGKLNSPLMKL